MKKIKDICAFYPKSKIKAGEGMSSGKYPFYTSSSILNKYLDFYNYESEGIILGTGGNASIHYCKEKFSVSTDCLVMYSKNDEIINEYLYYYLLNNIHILENGFRGAGLKHISKKYIEDIDVNYIPNKSTQEKIIQTIKLAEVSIDKRKKQIEILDELVKSRFIEMFGDPNLNSKNWEKEYLKDITTKIGSGATPKGGNSSYKKEGIYLIRSMNVHNNKFINKDLAFIDDEQAEKLRNVTIEENDVLLNITGASVARCCIVPNEYIPARVNQHVAILRCKYEQILPNFLCYQLTNEIYQRLLWDVATSGGATREAITKQQIENLEVIVPPLELQNKFADFVKQVDKLKFEIEKSLKELEDNFYSLMQKAFKGELF